MTSLCAVHHALLRKIRNTLAGVHPAHWCLPLAAAALLSACGGGTPTTTTSAPASLSALAAQDQMLTVTTSGSGTVVSNPSGVDCSNSCSASFPSGTAVTLNAQPAAGYAFRGWGGACSGVGNCNVTLASTQLVTAAFGSTSAGADYVLTLEQSGAGTVTSNPSGIQCQSSCSASFASAATVILAAQPAAGYTFAGWGGACSGSSNCTVSMSANQSVTVNFAKVAPAPAGAVPTSQVLTVTHSGSGSVLVNPGAASCAATCTTSLATGTVATLTAQAAAGYQFDGWGGACSGTATCSVTMNSAQSVSAAFSATASTDYSLVVSETGSGSVTSSPAGIDCGTACTASFAGATGVTLSAQAASGFTFRGWSGACTGTGTCAVTMSGAKSVAASFASTPASYTLTVVNGATGGVITSSPGGISCASACASSYTTGTVVTLTEQPQSGYVFAGWSGACTGSATSCSVTMTAAQTVTASFSSGNASNYTLTLSKAGTGSGTISSSPAGISCGATCSASFASGAVVALTAQAASGSTFSGWSGACSGTASCSVAMSAARSVTASYALSGAPSSALSVRVSGNRLIDANGNNLQLRGVNISGLETVAVQGNDPANPWGSQTGTATPQWNLIAQNWHANSVRLPLNAASWLGLTCTDLGGASKTNGVQNAPGAQISADPGGNYKQTVITSVQQANAQGMYVVLDLHWDTPGNICPEVQNPMATSDHAVAFWTSLAGTFGYPNGTNANASVIFELFNEPFLDTVTVGGGQTAGYYMLHGGGQFSTVYYANASQQRQSESYSWTNAGFQQMLDAVRAAGASNVVLIGTMSYDQTMGSWLTYLASDATPPAGYTGTWASQIGAACHPYPWPAGSSSTPTNLSAIPAIQAAGYPVVCTEFGDVVNVSPPPLVSKLLPQLDAMNPPVGYLAWGWNTWGSMDYILITDAAGDPTAGYGVYVQTHYACLAAGNSNCP